MVYESIESGGRRRRALLRRRLVSREATSNTRTLVLAEDVQRQNASRSQWLVTSEFSVPWKKQRDQYEVHWRELKAIWSLHPSEDLPEMLQFLTLRTRQVVAAALSWPGWRTATSAEVADRRIRGCRGSGGWCWSCWVGWVESRRWYSEAVRSGYPGSSSRSAASSAPLI